MLLSTHEGRLFEHTPGSFARVITRVIIIIPGTTTLPIPTGGVIK